MEKILLLSAIAIITISLEAQSHRPCFIYETFRGEEGVRSIYLPGFACRLAASIADLEKEERELLHSIKSLRIQVNENPDINAHVNYAKLLNPSYLEKSYMPLLIANDGDDDVLILAKEKNEVISELFILVGGDENVMVWIKGRIDRDLLKSLYNVTGIEATRLAKKI